MLGSVCHLCAATAASSAAEQRQWQDKATVWAESCWSAGRAGTQCLMPADRHTQEAHCRRFTPFPVLTVCCELPCRDASSSNAGCAVCCVEPVEWSLLALVQQATLHQLVNTNTSQLQQEGGRRYNVTTQHSTQCCCVFANSHLLGLMCRPP